MFRLLLVFFSLFLSGRVKNFYLNNLLGHNIDKTARIGFSILLVNKVFMAPGSRVSSLTVIKGLDFMSLGENSHIGSLNWISAFPTGTSSKHFSDDLQREAVLLVGDESAITSRHVIDCTNQVKIGKFSTFAGYRSQILTHSVCIYTSRQRSYPVEVGDYCFVGTGSILLPGSKLPDYSLLAAGSVLGKKFSDEFSIYGGIPAVKIKDIPKDAKYFTRLNGYII